MKTRRGIIAGAAAGIAVASGAALGALWRFTDIFVKHYAPTPYDDVLGRLLDREQAIRFGKAALPGMKGFDVRHAAAKLRVNLRDGGLSVAATIEAVNGRIIEADGWLVPESVALLSALAAKV
jgi:hypothetical protein